MVCGIIQRWKVCLVTACCVAAITWFSLPRTELYPEHLTFSKALEDRSGKIVHLTLTPDGKYRLRTPLERISKDLVAATMVQEDHHFHEHPGVNPLSLLRGLWGVVSNTAKGGGSTITMQYARLRFGLHTRTIPGKAVQIFRALQLERHHSKHDILEAYFNLAPYGANVEGIGAASLLWCGKTADKITPREAAALSVLPQSPTRRRPNQPGENPSLAAAQYRLMQRMQAEHGWRADPLDAGFRLRPEAGPPRGAPHLARRLLQAQPDRERVASTLDFAKQQTIERALNDYVGRHRDTGITNACAMLVRAPTREVLAYVGSAGFLDLSIQGQVDGVTARRSPGSALKPFVYALAMQEGIIHPRSLLRDAKLSFGEYNPENFDREFAGPIPAEDALFRSRNIPAVGLAQRLGGAGLYGFLQRAGVKLPKSIEHYGLSLPLGGGEVSMEELARIYAMLADDGSPRSLVFSKTTSANAPESAVLMLTAETCFLTRQMLKPREGEPQFDDQNVSWKTGTSHGFRDAWAAGIRGDYVLVIWIGNFNGKANPAFVARECAAPLLFETFRKLRLPRKIDLPPPGVDEVELCAVSGQLPSPHCQHRLRGWFIPGVSPIAPCEIHREVLIDPASHLRVVADDGRPGLRREVFEFWAPDLMELFRQAGLPRREPPPLEPSAKALQAATSREAPKIASPHHALVYTLRAKDPQRQTIPLRADTAPGVRTVYWFAGKRFLGASPPVDPLMWHADPGRWKLQVLDDHGRSASCEVRVEMVE